MNVVYHFPGFSNQVLVGVTGIVDVKLYLSLSFQKLRDKVENCLLDIAKIRLQSSFTALNVWWSNTYKSSTWLENIFLTASYKIVQI